MESPSTPRPGRSYGEFEQGLTPRTPHSRSGARTQSYGGHAQQEQPLLPSHSEDKLSSHLPLKDPGNRGHNRRPGHGVLHFLPLALGCLSAVFLFVLVVLSYRRPDIISYLIGDSDWDNTVILPGSEEGKGEVDVTEEAGSHPDSHLDTELLIDYSNYTQFPLSALEYAGECWKLNQALHAHRSFWEAGPHGVHDVLHADSPGTCASSITYMLDGEVGLVADLALLAQVAALAHERGRTLLVDDTYWNRGKWLDYFEDVRATQPGPEPGCTPPPANELVACPRLARQIISSRIAKFHMGHDFSEEYEDPYKQSIDRQRPIFETGRASLSSTIQPNAAILELIELAKSDLGEGPYIGVHMRRGDQNAMSWRYKKGYVPTEEYIRAVRKTWNRMAHTAAESLKVYVATDTPSAVQEFVTQAPTSWAVHSMRTSGQGRLREVASKESYDQASWEMNSEEDREALTKGMLVDLALVAGWSENPNALVATVCTLMSHVCKVAAMTLGWEEGITRKNWVEIDNARNIEPVWQPFTLYR